MFTSDRDRDRAINEYKYSGLPVPEHLQGASVAGKQFGGQGPGAGDRDKSEVDEGPGSQAQSIQAPKSSLVNQSMGAGLDQRWIDRKKNQEDEMGQIQERSRAEDKKA